MPGITTSAVRVLDAAVQKAYGGKRKINWFDVHAGDVARSLYYPEVKDEQVGKLSEDEQRKLYIPDDTLKAFEYYGLGLKGPLTTPIGGGIRSLNVALRQMLDLYTCLRPVRWFKGVPSPVKDPSQVDMVIFRENTEDIYAGIEFEEGSEDGKRVAKLLEEHFPERYKKIRFPKTSGFGIKPVSQDGSERLVRAVMVTCERWLCAPRSLIALEQGGRALHP